MKGTNVYQQFYALLATYLQRYNRTVIFSFLSLIVLPALSATPMTLDIAWKIAEQNNPDLKRAKAGLQAIQGELRDGNAVLYNNPTVNFEGRRRNVYQPNHSDASLNEWGGGIAQTFEIAGQQGLRRQSAQASLAAQDEEISEIGRGIRAQVEEQFVGVLAIQKQIEVEQGTLALIERNTQLSSKRVEAGEDSKLDGNLAIVDAERARNQLGLLQEQLTRAKSSLYLLLQAPQEDVHDVTGNIEPVKFNYTLDELLASAKLRTANKALSLREDSAHDRLALERSLVYPDVTVSLSYSREAGLDGDSKITSLGFSLPIPLFRKNATGIGRATTELSQVEIDHQAFERDTQASIRAAWERRENLQQRLQRLKNEVSPKLEENLKLSQLAFQSGEIGLPQLLLVQRQTIDAQRDLVDAMRDLRLTQIELEYAAGWPVTSGSNADSSNK